jgi:hypothetical protein
VRSWLALRARIMKISGRHASIGCPAGVSAMTGVVIRGPDNVRWGSRSRRRSVRHGYGLEGGT